MRTLSCLVVLATISSCSAPEPAPALSQSDRVAFRGFAFAFDYLVERNWQAPVCAAIEHDRRRSDPSDAVLQTLRHRSSRVLAYHQCAGVLDHINVLHDTLLVTVYTDSAMSAAPSIRVGIWRSGRWARGYVCRLRQDGTKEWKIDGCDVRWVASRSRPGRRLTSG
jgi:hypothetical protein